VAGSDIQAFDQFFGETKRALVGQAFLLTNDIEEAKDLAQEALLRAWREWDRVATLDDPKAWTRRVLHNLAVGHWRWAQRRQRHLRIVAEDVLAAVSPDPEAVDVASALKSLSPKHRQALVLKAVVGLSTSEIAQEMGASEGTVRVWLSRGRVEFAEAFGVDLERTREGGVR